MKKISRKEFFKKSSAGIAALGLISETRAETRTEASAEASAETSAETSAEAKAGNQAETKSSEPVGTMPLRKLGDTGMMVSELCFGASRTNNEGLIRYAIDSGINMLDTGRAYANGNNEKLVGRVTRDIRGEVVIQSKIYLEESELRFGGKGRKGAKEIYDTLSRRTEESLQALGTDYIDIMLYHSAEVEYLVFHEEVMKFYDSQKSQGLFRAHGFSSHDYELNILKHNNRERFWDIIMHPFNFSGSFIHSLSGWSARWDQEVLISELSKAAEIGVAVVAMKSCSAGPYSADNEKASYPGAVKWVLDNRFISSAAVAISSYEHLNEYLREYGITTI